jgi:hypothetical protein
MTPAPPIKPVVKHPQFAISIRVPVGWECHEAPKAAYFKSGMIVVEIYRKPLIGFARWWYEQVQHRNTALPPFETYRFELSVPMDDFSHAEQFFRGRKQAVRQIFPSLPGYPTAFRTFAHPLGQALQVTAYRLDPRGTGAVHGSESTFIVLDRLAGHSHLVLRASRNDLTSHSDPHRVDWDAIVRSIRVIQK